VISFIGGGNRTTSRKPQTCRKSLTKFFTYVASSTPRVSGFELTTLVVIGTDCTGHDGPHILGFKINIIYSYIKKHSAELNLT
jgi:hypothetical protein